MDARPVRGSQTRRFVSGTASFRKNEKPFCVALALDAFLLRAIVKENERYESVLHTMAKWVTDEERLEFLRKFGWLMKDALR